MDRVAHRDDGSSPRRRAGSLFGSGWEPSKVIHNRLTLCPTLQAFEREGPCGARDAKWRRDGKPEPRANETLKRRSEASRLRWVRSARR